MANFEFFITSMPDTRPADYYLGCLDASVFLDFNNSEDDRICLIRISFDRFGCCNLCNNAIPLNKEDSAIFKKIIQNQDIDQNMTEAIVKKAIMLNKSLIWADALEEYQLI